MTPTMKAVALSGTGGPEALAWADVALGWPAGDRDVLVRLQAAGLNPADGYFRQLGPYLDSGDPWILGHDGAGIVEAVGPAVTRVVPGDAVCFCNGGVGGHPGTYAEFATVPETQLVAKPASVGFEQAAALPLVLITAWEALCERGAVAAGEHVLIHAGAGGTGHVAIQLAALRGARIATTVSDDDKAAFVQSLGAERPIRYRDEDFVTASRAWTGGRGIDAALDNIGAEGLQRTYRAMAAYGRIVTLMELAADDADETAYLANLTVHAVMMLTPMILGLQDRLDAQARVLERGLALLADGRLAVHVSEVFDRHDLRSAHRRLDAGHTTGKLVLRIAR